MTDLSSSMPDDVAPAEGSAGQSWASRSAVAAREGGATYADAAPDGILAVDREGVIRYANASARELLAGTHSRVVGERCGFPVGEGPVEVELRTPAGGVRTAEMRVTHVVLQGADRWVVSLRDVTEGARRRRQVAQELQSIDDALAVTSHELRNPLSVLAMTVSALIESWDSLEDERRLYQLRRIERNAMRMAFTIDSILDAARISSGTFQPVDDRVDLHDLVLERLSELGDAANGIQVVVPTGSEVNAHPDHVWMILANLLVNSLKYGEAPREIRALQRGETMVVEVADSGPGVPEESVGSLFERYTRGPGQEGVAGTGLGLWIARSTAEAYGGRVHYRRGDPDGAVFSCVLRRPRAVEVPRSR